MLENNVWLWKFEQTRLSFSHHQILCVKMTKNVKLC